MKKVAENLQRARDLIAPPEKWCINHRYKNGAYCALGAIDAVIDGKNSHSDTSDNCTPEVVALAAAIPHDIKVAIERGQISDSHNTVPGYGASTKAHATKVAVYNNTSDHKTVLQWFDRAIQLQREHPMEKV